MIVHANFYQFSQYISCTDNIGQKIEALQKLFFDWLYDHGNKHQYWVYAPEGWQGVEYDAEAFVFWLNECHFKRKVAELIPNSTDVEKQAERTINF